MPFPDDSGIDSEDKQSIVCDEAEMDSERKSGVRRGTAEHMADLEVAFRGLAEASAASQPCTAAGFEDHSDHRRALESSDRPPSTCRILQRKLELKVERARRHYCQHQEEGIRKSQSATLIPISRLPIPGDVEQEPLVDYKSDGSDEVEEISFFPARLPKGRSRQHAELTDTFSIQEMAIESDVDSEDGCSQNLELLTPTTKSNLFDTLRLCLCLRSSS